MIRSPEQLKSLSLPELQDLAEDIRQTIISVCLKNGGHIGASLGAVELAIALHTVFQSPEEPIIWDVGHQAYAHKLLTGRWEDFSSLRLLNGISGFLKRDESPHDVFGAGHSSTALSAALGIAWAKGRIKSKKDWTVAVVGDGGLTAGLCFEGLNNIRTTATGPLLVVLNDNQMSISQNVGAISSILSGNETESFFRLFGFEYVGPVDGHDLGSLIEELRRVRSYSGDRPILLHALTIKGKGYSPAEEQPAIYHGISPVQKSQSSKTAAALPAKTYSQAFGEALCELAEKDPKIVAITAAMPEGTGLTGFSQKFPDRFFDVGIAEAHAVTFAAGLATQGYKPVVAIYSTFLQRAIDSMIHDVALQDLGVTFALDRAGIVGADGPTHHGMFDLAYLGMIPGMTVTAPSCLDDLSWLLSEAIHSGKPWSIRYPRGGGPQKIEAQKNTKDWVRFHQQAVHPRVILIGIGMSAEKVRSVAAEVDPTSQWITAVSTPFVKPIAPALATYLDQNRDAHVFCVEDGSKIGGFGQQLLSFTRNPSFEIVAYEDHFVSHGTATELERQENVSKEALKERILQFEKMFHGKKTT